MPQKRKKKKNRNWDKILTLNKLLTKLLVLLAQMEARNNSCKLKNKIRKITKKFDTNLITSL